MGKIDFTPPQTVIVSQFCKKPDLASRFYLTGGTALSVFYLNHRWSEDLDFFSEERFDTGEIIGLVSEWSGTGGFIVEVKQIEDVLVFGLKFGDGTVLKVDFNYYPYRRLRQGELTNGLSVDSLLDIAVNKMLLINQRTDIKDFVDLYFLRDKHSWWELMEGVKRKFNFELEPILVSADMMKVEEFDFMPRMNMSLALTELQEFFRGAAKELTGEVVE